MCGINGIFAYDCDAPPISIAELARTRDQMKARGPDGFGEWVSANGRLGLGHRRLSIIDLTQAGAQPMASADGRMAITFNGEIYNYRELRRRLEAQGRIFRSSSDTEVLLHLYELRGEAMVHELRGMFAFAVWDEAQRSLFLARDPYGIKPLYYADDGRTFRFASQAKALIAGGGCDAASDPAGWAGFFMFGSVPEPFTVYSRVRALPAGMTLTVNARGAGAAQRYHSVAKVYAESLADATAAVRKGDGQQEAIRAALADSVAHHLVADVPVGAFLSAGIDSGALVGLMRDAGQSDIPTVTLKFPEYEGTDDDEAEFAARVARHYGTRHTTRTISRSEFEADLPRIFEAMDQPSIDGVNTWFVSKAAHELGLKVAVSGLGGDELFGSYPSFRDVPAWVRRFTLPQRAGLLGARLRRLALALGAERVAPSPKALALLEHGGDFAGAYFARRGLFMPWELPDILDRDFVEKGLSGLDPVHLIAQNLHPDPGSDFARVATLEATFYMRNQLLRDTDWASMAHSVEVRVPLVDAVLLKALTRLDTGLREPKRHLGLAPSKPLPQEVMLRRKSGFRIPVETWIREAAGPASGGPRSRGWAIRVARHAGLQPMMAV